MVDGALGGKTAGSKVMVSPLCASSNTWRKVPGPASAVLVTTKVFPCGIGVIVVSSGVVSEDEDVASGGGSVNSLFGGVVSLGSGDIGEAVQALSRIMLTVRSNSDFLIAAIIA